MLTREINCRTTYQTLKVRCLINFPWAGTYSSLGLDMYGSGRTDCQWSRPGTNTSVSGLLPGTWRSDRILQDMDPDTWASCTPNSTHSRSLGCIRVYIPRMGCRSNPAGICTSLRHFVLCKRHSHRMAMARKGLNSRLEELKFQIKKTIEVQFWESLNYNHIVQN